MSKRVGYLYEKLLDRNLIRDSIYDALRHKEESNDVIKIRNNMNYYIEYIYIQLKNNSYKFRKGYMKQIHNGTKIRDIQVPYILDHIVQHLMMTMLSPIIIKSMYKWNSGVVPKRGPLYAKNYVEKIIRKHKPKYALKLDIKKYFHNIDTSVLITQFKKKIKDKRFLNLLSDLLTTANEVTNKGIPIGFYSSQWLSNFYLQSLDYYIKQELNVKWYVRYVDDLVLMGNNKRHLHRIKNKIIKYMKEVLHLEINTNYQVYQISKRPIDFVGYKMNHDVTRLRKQTFKIFLRRHNKLKYNINIYLCRSYLSLRGWLTHTKIGNTFLNTNESKLIYDKARLYVSRKDKERYNELCKSY